MPRTEIAQVGVETATDDPLVENANAIVAMDTDGDSALDTEIRDLEQRMEEDKKKEEHYDELSKTYAALSKSKSEAIDFHKKQASALRLKRARRVSRHGLRARRHGSVVDWVSGFQNQPAESPERDTRYITSPRLNQEDEQAKDDGGVDGVQGPEFNCSDGEI